MLPIDCQIYTGYNVSFFCIFSRHNLLWKMTCHVSGPGTQTHNWFWHERIQISFKVDGVEKTVKARKHWLKHIKHIHMLRCAHTEQKPKQQISRELSGWNLSFWYILICRRWCSCLDKIGSKPFNQRRGGETFLISLFLRFVFKVNAVLHFAKCIESLGIMVCGFNRFDTWWFHAASSHFFA